MLVDTNIMVYASAKGAPHREQARAALAHYAAAGETLCISRQVLREFLAVVTRPWTWAQAQTAIEGASVVLTLARDFEILEDGPQVWDQLVALCRGFAFGGRQVHDANIVATMLAHGETGLLTFNIADFQRFASVINLLPLVVAS